MFVNVKIGTPLGFALAMNEAVAPVLVIAIIPLALIDSAKF